MTQKSILPHLRNVQIVMFDQYDKRDDEHILADRVPTNTCRGMWDYKQGHEGWIWYNVSYAQVEEMDDDSYVTISEDEFDGVVQEVENVANIMLEMLGVDDRRKQEIKSECHRGHELCHEPFRGHAHGLHQANGCFAVTRLMERASREV